MIFVSTINTFTLDYLTPIKGKENEYNDLIKDLIKKEITLVIPLNTKLFG